MSDKVTKSISLPVTYQIHSTILPFNKELLSFRRTTEQGQVTSPRFPTFGCGLLMKVGSVTLGATSVARLEETSHPPLSFSSSTGSRK